MRQEGARGRTATDALGEFPEMNPGPVCRLDLGATVLLANPAAHAAFGEDTLLGRCWLDLCPSLTREAWDTLIATGEPTQHELEIEGQCFTFTMAHRPGSDSAFVYGADVTELRRAQDELAGQAAELRENALFPEMNPGPVARLDLDATVLRANRAAKSLFGDPLIGSCLRDLVPGISDELWAQVLGGGEPLHHEAEFGGTWFAFTIAHTPESQYVFVYGADITDLKAAEKQITEMARFPEMNPGPVLRLDCDGTVKLANRAAREAFGGQALVGRLWQEICPGVTGELWDEVIQATEVVGHEAQILDRPMLFTHTPGAGEELVFVFGADLTGLKVAERALRQSEKMATLGTLAAGVAHELNNPSAAVQRAAEHLQDTFAKLQVAQLALGQVSLSPETLDVLAELDREARGKASDPPEFNPVARSDQEYEVECWLEDEDVEDEWDLAPALVSMGFGPDELQELADRLEPEQLSVVVTWLSRTFPVYGVLAEIRFGAGRLSEIVGALKAYSYVGQAPIQAVDVNEGIRHTLIILRSKLKKGVTVELELSEDLPRIQAYGAELNQVWTNLIDNAADAMEGEGRLIIRSALCDDAVRIEVEDDGPGIPQDIQARVFDPFFTTKEPGQGTGLGLNTTYNVVVKKHGGRIGLDSEPGRTVFSIELPLDAGSVEDDGQPELDGAAAVAGLLEVED